MSSITDTITAIATPPGRGGVGVVRISGPLALEIAERITKKHLSPRQALFTSFYDEEEKVLDEGLALFFPHPHSFTGEDVVELQAHGSPMVLDLMIQTILRYGARLARPGEFSERAFLNDKMDLVQAEAVADLIEAGSHSAARSALRSLQGEFSKQINELLEALIYSRTFIEASLDFPEEDVELIQAEKVMYQLEGVLEKITSLLQQAKVGVLFQEGLHVLILGRPNVGKSSLLNALAKNEVAIVSELPGTTRDLVRTQLLVQGIPLHVIDTAGLRDSFDAIEQEGVRRALSQLAQVDLVLWVRDASLPGAIDDISLHKELQDLLGPFEKAIHRLPFIMVMNKIDLIKMPAQLSRIKLHFNSEEKMISWVGLSARYAEGLSYLETAILDMMGVKTENTHQFIARRRHVDALERAKIYLEEGLMHFRTHQALELVAEDCRLAQEALGEITGAFRSEDLLGRIFSTFCIGK